MTATGAPNVFVKGKGTYHGSLEVRSSSNGLDAINVVELEDYVRGVVAKESPASWPIEALKAQAVAARSYAIATPSHRGAYDLFDDTRSQVYGGSAPRPPKSDQAVSATAGQVVIYGGRVAQTFFFSTSGGHAETNEFSSLGFGQPAIPYLRGVDDPYEADAGSPSSTGSGSSRSGGWNRRSPGWASRRAAEDRREAEGLLSADRAREPGRHGGTTAVNGPQLADALGLPDTWAFFKKKGRHFDDRGYRGRADRPRHQQAHLETRARRLPPRSPRCRPPAHRHCACLHGRRERARDRRGAFAGSPTGSWLPPRAATAGAAARRRSARRSRRASRAFGTDAIDLYYLHRVDPEMPLEESLGAIAEYREAGKIKEVGISAVDVEQIEAARSRPDRGGAEPLQRRGARLGRRRRLLRGERDRLRPVLPAQGRRAAGPRGDRGEPPAPPRSRSRSPGCFAARR